MCMQNDPSLKSDSRMLRYILIGSMNAMKLKRFILMRRFCKNYSFKIKIFSDEKIFIVGIFLNNQNIHQLNWCQEHFHGKTSSPGHGLRCHVFWQENKLSFIHKLVQRWGADAYYMILSCMFWHSWRLTNQITKLRESMMVLPVTQPIRCSGGAKNLKEYMINSGAVFQCIVKALIEINTSHTE